MCSSDLKSGDTLDVALYLLRIIDQDPDRDRFPSLKDLKEAYQAYTKDRNDQAVLNHYYNLTEKSQMSARHMASSVQKVETGTYISGDTTQNQARTNLASRTTNSSISTEDLRISFSVDNEYSLKKPIIRESEVDKILIPTDQDDKDLDALHESEKKLTKLFTSKIEDDLFESQMDDISNKIDRYVDIIENQQNYTVKLEGLNSFVDGLSARAQLVNTLEKNKLEGLQKIIDKVPTEWFELQQHKMETIGSLKKATTLDTLLKLYEIGRAHV